MPRFRELLKIYEQGSGAKNSWEKTFALRLGALRLSNALPSGWIEGRDINFIGAAQRYLGIFLGAPVAVANTIMAVVIAFIPPIYFTPYISAQVEDPNTFAKPFEIPISPNNRKEKNGSLKKYKTITANKSGIFIYNNNFLLVNLSIKYPDKDKVITDKIE